MREDSYDTESVRNTIRDVHLHEELRYKKSFLVYVKDQIIPVSVDQVAYFYLEYEMVYCTTKDQKKYLIDQPLDKIWAQLNPEDFFRANRQYIISRSAIKSAVQHFNRRLKLKLSPSAENEVLISKAKAAAFKDWLES
jgi:two-component system LytT family response regulator